MSLSYKTRLFLFKIFVFAVAAYLFYRHNAYCEPYGKDLLNIFYKHLIIYYCHMRSKYVDGGVIRFFIRKP